MELPDYLPERIREVVEVDRLSRFLLTQYMRSTVCTPPRHKGHLPPFSTVLTQVGQRHQCPHGCIACVFALVRQMQHGSASALRRSPPPAPSGACAFGRLVQQTEKRRCVSAWSLVHQAEKRRCCFLPRPSASSLTAWNLEQQTGKRRCCPPPTGFHLVIAPPTVPADARARGGSRRHREEEDDDEIDVPMMLRYAVFP